jgi:hypothetical protein
LQGTAKVPSGLVISSRLAALLGWRAAEGRQFAGFFSRF